MKPDQAALSVVARWLRLALRGVGRSVSMLEVSIAGIAVGAYLLTRTLFPGGALGLALIVGFGLTYLHIRSALREVGIGKR